MKQIKMSQPFRSTDTVKQICKGLEYRPSDFILFKETVAFGGGFRGCRGRKGFLHFDQMKAVEITILQ